MRIYVAQKFCRWGDMTWTSPLVVPVNLTAPDSVPGCLLAFSSMEALQRVYPDTDESHVLVFEIPDPVEAK